MGSSPGIGLSTDPTHSLYCPILGEMIRQHNVNMHFYADDTQLSLSFEPGNTVSENASLLQLEKCIGIIKNWIIG